MTMASENFPTPVLGRSLYVSSGNAAGDIRVAARIDPIHGTLWPSAPFTAAVASGDSYELWGSAIHGGQALTDLFNDVIRRLHPPTYDQVTIVTNQARYDISNLVQVREDVIEVWIRMIDLAGIRPFEPIPMMWWDVVNYGGGGTTSVEMQISPTLTASSYNQLWVEHYKVFAQFTDNTTLVDSIYRDWLVWEAIYEHCQRMSELVNRDTKEWQSRMKRAQRELVGLRERFLPRRPVRIRPERFGA